MKKKYYTYWLGLSFVITLGLVFAGKEIVHLIQADVVNIGAVVPVNVIDSTPVIGTITSNCTVVNWEGMIPINDSVSLQNGQYNVDISSSPTFAEIIESSGYRTGTTYSVAATLSASQNYYYRLRAQDLARPTEKSHYSATKMCQITSVVGSSGGGSSGGGGGGSSWSGSSSSFTSQNTPPSQPITPATTPSTKDETLDWLKVIVVDPFINTRPVELLIETGSATSGGDLTLPKNSTHIITVKPKAVKKIPTLFRKCHSILSRISLVSSHLMRT